jgi:uridine kinase
MSLATRTKPQILHSVEELVAELRSRKPNGGQVFVVAFDGRSGAGKSTLASVVAPLLGAVVPSDDFFAASIPDSEWDRKTPEQRAEGAIDWRRLRLDAIEPQRAGLPARWFAFDFAAGLRPDGTYPMQGVATERAPAQIVIVDGAYSSRSELADLLDVTVLVNAPQTERNRRLAAREDAAFLETWHARWDAAEDHYFGRLRPPTSFDLVFETFTGTRGQ